MEIKSTKNYAITKYQLTGREGAKRTACFAWKCMQFSAVNAGQ